MENNNLEELYNNMQKIHEKATVIYDQTGIPSALKNEFKNKVSQYSGMYESVENMKELTSKPDTLVNLINQQVEIMNVWIKWELDWAKRAACYVSV